MLLLDVASTKEYGRRVGGRRTNWLPISIDTLLIKYCSKSHHHHSIIYIVHTLSLPPSHTSLSPFFLRRTTTPLTYPRPSPNIAVKLSSTRSLARSSSASLTTTMDSPKPSNSMENGKAPATNNVGFRPQNQGIVKVQPPRREDLQPSYAQTLVFESEAAPHGWYSSMSASASSVLGISRLLTISPSKCSRIHRWVSRRNSLLRCLPESLQARLARKRRSHHKVWKILPRRRSRSGQGQSAL